MRRSGTWLIAAGLLQLLVGIYGGYFGAGISIMMLSLLGILGMTDILEMNALTSLFSLCINGSRPCCSSPQNWCTGRTYW